VAELDEDAKLGFCERGRVAVDGIQGGAVGVWVVPGTVGVSEF
jgi:hypothetical protein